MGNTGKKSNQNLNKPKGNEETQISSNAETRESQIIEKKRKVTQKSVYRVSSIETEFVSSMRKQYENIKPLFTEMQQKFEGIPDVPSWEAVERAISPDIIKQSEKLVQPTLVLIPPISTKEKWDALRMNGLEMASWTEHIISYHQDPDPADGPLVLNLKRGWGVVPQRHISPIYSKKRLQKDWKCIIAEGVPDVSIKPEVKKNHRAKKTLAKELKMKFKEAIERYKGIDFDIIHRPNTEEAWNGPACNTETGAIVRKLIPLLPHLDNRKWWEIFQMTYKSLRKRKLGILSSPSSYLMLALIMHANGEQIDNGSSFTALGIRAIPIKDPNSKKQFEYLIYGKSRDGQLVLDFSDHRGFEFARLRGMIRLHIDQK